MFVRINLKHGGEESLRKFSAQLAAFSFAKNALKDSVKDIHKYGCYSGLSENFQKLQTFNTNEGFKLWNVRKKAF